jgi:hypothetical protein
MRRVAVIGPNPPCGALSGERFVELLSRRLGLEAFSLRPVPGLVLATGGEGSVPLGGRSTPGMYGTAHVEADTLIWLRFSPRAYLRDWLAGWLDVLLNNAGRAYRARLLDVARACTAFLQKAAVDSQQIEMLRPHVLFLELSSPEQAFFWLQMQEERARETEPPRE